MCRLEQIDLEHTDLKITQLNTILYHINNCSELTLKRINFIYRSREDIRSCQAAFEVDKHEKLIRGVKVTVKQERTENRY